MHQNFWQERWARNEIGFHLEDVHPACAVTGRGWLLPEDAAVLVPLCGKSLDLAWPAGQGHRVLGVELSQKAVEAFFRRARTGGGDFAGRRIQSLSIRQA